VVDELLVDRARLLSAEHLISLPMRWAHVQSVALSASRVASLVDPACAGEIVAAAWLHDIGYAPTIKRTGFHPVDGAEFARDAGFPTLVVSLIAYHTGATAEAAQRGLQQRLAAIPEPPRVALDVLTRPARHPGEDHQPSRDSEHRHPPDR
jgi:putative nucleotidyltransferase with HDIG domain